MKYRVGRKEKRAILFIETGYVYLIFPKGSDPKRVEEYCDYLNSKSNVDIDKLESKILKYLNETSDEEIEKAFDKVYDEKVNEDDVQVVLEDLTIKPIIRESHTIKNAHNLLSEIDELLTFLEDTAHGEEGMKINEMRYKIMNFKK